MVCGVDLIGLINGTVVQPENNITVIPIFIVEVWASDADRFIIIVRENGERTGSVKSNTSNRAIVNIVLVHCSADRGTNGSPNVGSGLLLFEALSLLSLSANCLASKLRHAYIVTRLRLPQANILRSQTNNIALIIHDASSCTASADINTNIVLHMRMELITRVC